MYKDLWNVSNLMSRKGLFGGQQWLVDISWSPVSRKGLFGDRRRSVVLAGHRCLLKGLFGGQQWLGGISWSPVSRKGLFGDRRWSFVLAGRRCPVKGSLVANNGWLRFNLSYIIIVSIKMLRNDINTQQTNSYHFIKIW